MPGRLHEVVDNSLVLVQIWPAGSGSSADHRISALVAYVASWQLQAAACEVRPASTTACDSLAGLIWIGLAGHSGSPGSARRKWIDGGAAPHYRRHHPVLVLMVIGLGAGFLTTAMRPSADADVMPYGLPLHGLVGGLLGVGFGAFLVTGALAGCERR
jgi:hypothetical protein